MARLCNCIMPVTSENAFQYASLNKQRVLKVFALRTHAVSAIHSWYGG